MLNFGECRGISFVDSTRLRVCDNKRISSHRVFAAHAGRSKTSMGGFYGFRLHLIINEKGDLLGVELSPGNTDDRQPLWKLSSVCFSCVWGLLPGGDENVFESRPSVCFSRWREHQDSILLLQVFREAEQFRLLRFLGG